MKRTAADVASSKDRLAESTLDIQPRRPHERVLDVALVLTAASIDWFLTLPLYPELTLTKLPVWVAVLGLVAAGLARHRNPWRSALAAIGVTTFMHVVYPPTGVLSILTLTLHTAAVRLGRSRARILLTLAMVPLFLLVFQNRLLDPAVDPISYLFITVFFGGLLVGFWLLGRRVHHGRVRADDLSLQLEQRAQMAAMQERQRIARELHDILSHSVSAMMLQAAGAKAVLHVVATEQPEDRRVATVEQALARIERTGTQSMRELHRLMDTLRADVEPAPTAHATEVTAHQPVLGEPVVDDPTGPVPIRASFRPGVHELDGLVEEAGRNGLDARMHQGGDRQTLDPSVDATVYRLVQEALTNAMKHAGRGAEVDIVLAWAATRLEVEVRCRAVGENPLRPRTPSSGTGLPGLRERVEVVGGVFEAGWQGPDFVTRAGLPLRPTHDPHRTTGPHGGGPVTEEAPA